MDSLIRRVRRLGGWADILLIILVSALTYLPLVGQLGYYRDDWHVAWGSMTQGPAKIIDLHLIDRPVMGVFYSLTYSLLGDAPLAWQLYAIAARIAGALIFLWLLRMLWPARRFSTTLMALLFVIYPGFLQMPTASAYQNHLVGLGLGILSIALSIRALRVQRMELRALLVALSIVNGMACYFIMEYMISLEAVRLLLLGYLLYRDHAGSLKEKALRLLRRWLPYLVGLGVFLVWRVIIFKSARSVTDLGSLTRRYLAEPGFMAGRLVIEMVKGALNALFLAWGVPLYNVTMQASNLDLFVSAVLALVVIAIVLLFWRAFHDAEPVRPQGNAEDHWSTHAIWLGLAIVLINLLPIVLANRDIRLTDTFDRYTLPASLGVVMLLVGLMDSGLQPILRAPLLALLLGICVLTQYNNAAYFRNFWEDQRQLWWQLSWRAPGLAKDAVLIPSLPPGYGLAESYEVWGPANLIYGTKQDPLTVVGEVPNDDTLHMISGQKSQVRTVRRVKYTLDFKNSLIMSIPAETSCLHVYDANWLEFPESESQIIRLIARYSNPGVIDLQGQHPAPPGIIFGKEPAHNWCYYYQKASLARQKKDWQEIGRLGDQVEAQGLKPQDLSEWMPFYEGYARLSRFDDANRVTAFIRDDKIFVQEFCSQFDAARLSAIRKGSTDEFLVINLCPAPE